MSRGDSVTVSRQVGTLLAAVAALAGCASADPPVELQGHRGARGLAPENTVAAFETALRVGVHTWEFDLGVSADSVLVVSHDPRLNPNLTRDSAGRWIDGPGAPINTLTLAELRRYDIGRIRAGTRYAQDHPAQQPSDGQRMPTLDEVFELARRRADPALRFNIETKINPHEPTLTPAPDAFAALVVDAIRRNGMQHRATVQSFDWRTLVEVRRLAPEIRTAALTARQRWLDNLSDGRWTAGLRLSDHGASVPRLVQASGARVWSPFHGELTAAEVAEAHALGLKVIPWTVNDPSRMAQLLDWKVDGLITDRPDLARPVIAARGLPLPPPGAAR